MKKPRKLNTRDLLKLADLLEADARNRKGVKFDLSVVARAQYAIDANGDTIYNENGPVYEKIGVNCGTYACAMGLAAISGAFSRQGLGFKLSPFSRDIKTTINGRMIEWRLAAERIFGLLDYEITWLFTSEGYETTPEKSAGERQVAKRIRNFVAGKEFPPIFDAYGNQIMGRVL